MKKVLLIDDDPLLNFVTQKIIETTGIPCQIMVAMNGKQGIELLTEEKENGHQLPDIILLDINMPIVDGFEFLRQVEGLNLLKDSNSTIAIVTSSNCDRDKLMAQQFGITTFLVKPISIDVARDILTGMMEIPALR